MTTYLIGIDEAGVGPVLGPMVVSGVLIDATACEPLSQIGVQDSKVFGSSVKSRQTRENIYNSSLDFIISQDTQLISAAELDQQNMYDLEFAAITRILDKLDWQRADIIYIAQLGQTKKETMFGKLAMHNQVFATKVFWDKVIYEIDADAKFVPVALASIIAKTTRDQEITRLCQEINFPYISGYPNKNTADFLQKYVRENRALPPQVRKSRDWAPLKDLLLELA